MTGSPTSSEQGRIKAHMVSRWSAVPWLNFNQNERQVQLNHNDDDNHNQNNAVPACLGVLKSRKNDA